MVSENQTFMIKVCIADNLPIVRFGIASFYKDDITIKVVAQANSFKQLQAVLKDKPIDVLITDLDLKGLKNLNQLKKIITEFKSTNLIVFSCYNPDVYEANLMKIGVKKFVSKFDNLQLLSHSIMQVVDYKTKATDANEYKQDMLDKSKSDCQFNKKLSVREMEVLRFILEGKKNIEIAEILHLNQKTVGTYKLRIFRKFGVSNLVSLIEKAKLTD